ncbi:UDP-N-acetylglucosamine 4,6-dehydratase (inverting) [Amylibacter sp.]|nr:UDP-N-acetylglucosamine 4,6-dehydratase (inverting) [Amylibacter sp.]
MKELENKTILITGGTGSFGNAFVQKVLSEGNPKKMIIFSRDEMKQWEMQQRIPDDRIRFFLGDVRDYRRLKRALDGVDIVIHAAAMKIVPLAEYNPFEYVKTNIDGAMNLIDACIDKGVEKLIALSTDKASDPINLYGGTKFVSDKLFCSANSYAKDAHCKFSVVRYGNVMGSRGSVIPFFLKEKTSGILPITDPRMTRFMITLEQGVEAVLHALDDMVGGEIYVRKIPSMKVTDVALSIDKNAEQKIVGIRSGEKIHEIMISSNEAAQTYEYCEYYKILPQFNYWGVNNKMIKDGKPVPDGFQYSSDKNDAWMSNDELQEWIRKTY